MAEMVHFFCRLVPPRPDFMTTMTDAERSIMRAHLGYWSGKVATGNAVLFGPVADPAGGFGIGVMKAASMDEMLALRDADPATQANVGFRYEIAPMPQVVIASAK
jgi:uncharacterized protein YciI